MRDFTWNYFSMTGDVDAYLFYKEMTVHGGIEEPIEDELETDGPEVVN